MRTFRDIQDEVLSYGWGTADRDRVKTWINSAYQDVASRTRWDWTQGSIMFTVSPGSATSPVPATVAIWGRVRPVDVDGAEPQFVDWHSFNSGFVDEPSLRLAEGMPEVYALNGGQIHWAPTPDDAYTYSVECWVTPNPLINDLDEPMIPVPDREVLLAGTCLRAATRDQNGGLMQHWGAQYEGMVAKMKQRQGLAQTETPRYIPMPASYGGMFGH